VNLRAAALALAAAAMPALPRSAEARDATDAAPPGSALHTVGVVGEEWSAARTDLADAHRRLVAALDRDPGRPSPLARALVSQQDAWLAYRDRDCELAGALTGAGGAWPSVHGLSCRIEHARQRIAALDAATACMHGLAPDELRHGQPECLGGLVDWEMEGN